MRYDEIEEWSRVVARWSNDYLASLRELPVRSQVKPGEIAAKIAPEPPESAESMATIFDDFKSIIPIGMTHWQHPRFFAYFPSNAAPAAMIAEQLVSTMAAQCMLWQTSPAATELETVMIDWLRQALGLPEGFSGVIQDSATSATLSAILTMRERALGWSGVHEGLSGCPPLRIYASDQNHSSITKAVRIAGIGENNLVKIPTDATWAMRPDLLLKAIESDRVKGFKPAGVIGCIGGTSIGACDRLRDILSIAREQQLSSHVDAAWAGSAMICPEYRSHWEGIELADSIVVNPHKWLGASFDCSVQFLRHPEDQIKTIAVRPHYLETLGHAHPEPQNSPFRVALEPVGKPVGTELFPGKEACGDRAGVGKPVGTELFPGKPVGTELFPGACAPGDRAVSGGALGDRVGEPLPQGTELFPAGEMPPNGWDPSHVSAVGESAFGGAFHNASWDGKGTDKTPVTGTFSGTETATMPQQAEHLRNYSEWTIPLGRRFRALKLWFLFRAYGLEGLRGRIRNHVQWATWAAAQISRLPNMEITSRPSLALFTFRLAPTGKDAELATRLLLQEINDDGRIYLTQTNLSGQFVIRFSIGQFETTREDVQMALKVIEEISREVTKSLS